MAGKNAAREPSGRGQYALRRGFEAVARRAAEAGYPGAGRLFELTPAEIVWELTAFAARQQAAMERLDDLAWLTGRYAAIGVNAPRKFPRRPDGVRRRSRAMEPEAMKRVFVNLSRRAEDGLPSAGEIR